jgi:hypothetical protein
MADKPEQSDPTVYAVIFAVIAGSVRGEGDKQRASMI